MSKIQIFPKGNFYKANLHCHTTVSDGRFSPEEIKKLYKEKGYNVVAFTDHRVLCPHLELQDEEFVALTALEFDCNEPDVAWPATKTYHLNFIAKDKNKTEFVPFERVHSVDGINKVIKEAKEAGFLCTFNHPRWSMNKSEDIIGIENLTAFEIYNTAAEFDLFNGDGEYEYELFCRAGGKSGVVAADDTHKPQDMFGGFTIISAQNLSYESIINALENGDYYASTGPLIEELIIEDKILKIKTSPCYKIGVFTESRWSALKYSETKENTLTEASLNINFPFKYIRLVVVDKNNNRLFTRAYFKEELE